MNCKIGLKTFLRCVRLNSTNLLAVLCLVSMTSHSGWPRELHTCVSQLPPLLHLHCCLTPKVEQCIAVQRLDELPPCTSSTDMMVRSGFHTSEEGGRRLSRLDQNTALTYTVDDRIVCLILRCVWSGKKCKHHISNNESAALRTDAVRSLAATCYCSQVRRSIP